jgi:uncharacterized protein
MVVNLSGSTLILELIEKYSFLMETLIGISPKLKKLNNPILKRTIGKKATLTDVAKIANISLNLIIDKLSKSLKLNSDVEVIEEKPVKADSNWQNELIKRQKSLKTLVLDLHEGKEMDNLKQQFSEIVKDVSAAEIAEMEQSLIDGGELSVEQVTKMCDLHVQIFHDSLDNQQKPNSIPGHPIHTYISENEALTKKLEEVKKNPDNVEELKKLEPVIVHYTRLENQLFPLLEKAGVSGPSTVMWTIHDEIRDDFRQIKEGAKINSAEFLQKIEDMVYKEDNILFPMSIESLSEQDWGKVLHGEEEIGYAWIKPSNQWKPITPEDIHAKDNKQNADGEVKLNLNTGLLTLTEIDRMFRTLPVDISFMDADEKVAYYSNTEERLFPRSPGVIGRQVKMCHPRKSLDKVQSILTAFKKGEKKEAEFWIHLGDKYIHIRYFAVHDDNGKFLGTMEVSQDIKPIQAIEGDRRLLDW